MRNGFILLLILCGLSGLTGCGFQPRGNLPLAPPLHNLYFQSADPYSTLSHNIKQYLKASGVHLAATPEQATTILRIISENTGQQLLTVSGTQQTRQYNLILTVIFQIENSKGVPLYPAQTVSETRTIPISSNQILGGSNEANNLYNQMRQAIVYDMMTLLASKNATQALMAKTP